MNDEGPQSSERGHNIPLDHSHIVEQDEDLRETSDNKTGSRDEAQANQASEGRLAAPTEKTKTDPYEIKTTTKRSHDSPSH